MVINGLGYGNISDNKLLTITPMDTDYLITSADHQTVGGVVPAANSRVTTPPGRGPWTVKLGFGGFSQSGQATGVQSPDAVVTGLMVFPSGPNTFTIIVKPPMG